MDQFPNGAGYRPEVEDVPTKFDEDQAKEDGECLKCGGEVKDVLIGDETYPMCGDCDEVQH